MASRFDWSENLCEISFTSAWPRASARSTLASMAPILTMRPQFVLPHRIK